MSNLFKPKNYNSVSPYLIVSDAESTIKFLVQVFDAEEIRRFLREDGRIMHAEVRIDDSVVMLSEAQDTSSTIPALVHIYVKDVDEIYRRALEAGATSLQEPVVKDDPDKRGGVKDVWGTSWWISTATES